MQRLVNEAQLAFFNRKYAEAEDFCRQAIKLDRRNALGYELLGDSARKQGRTEEAIQAYSLAVQLNPRNQSVQANLDRLLGTGGASGRSGPILARKPDVPLGKRVSRDLVVNGVGGLSLIGMGGSLAALYLFPGEAMLAGLSPNLLVVLIVTGLFGGVLLALYGGMRPQAQELAARGNSSSSMPLNSILALFSLVWFFASLLAYVVVAVTRNRVSASVLRAYALALILNVVFVLLYHPIQSGTGSEFSPAAAAFAGNLLFPAILAGWRVGDGLRLKRYGGS